MLSYLHAFHAGNFADVQKHAALCLVLEMMQAKPAPIACFDTHAGSALYDLTGERARKTAEADSGIQAVWSQRHRLSGPGWRRLLAEIGQLNRPTGELTRYPGSPQWLAALKRPQDAVTAFELHPTEYARLAEWAVNPGVTVKHEEGLKGLLRRLPPKAPRLVTLIDPSYEIKSEYRQVGSTLVSAWRRCRHGVYVIWYPVLPGNPAQALWDTLTASDMSKVMRSELMLQQPPTRGMVGTGLLVVNPPWGFGERFADMMVEVSGNDCLNARHQLDWLIPESGV